MNIRAWVAAVAIGSAISIGTVGALGAEVGSPPAPPIGVLPLGADGKPLNLDFETSGRGPSRGAHEASTELPAAKATHGDSAEVGGQNRGRIRPPATDSMKKPMGDSTRRDTTRRDSTMKDTTSH